MSDASPLKNWDIIQVDKEGNPIVVLPRSTRSTRNALAFQTYYKIVNTHDRSITFMVGDVVVFKYNTAVNSTYLIKEIRHDGTNNTVEIFGFDFLRWYELDGKDYFNKYNPKILEEHPNEDNSFYQDLLLQEVDTKELFLTAEVTTLHLSDFIRVLNVVDLQTYLELKEKNSIEDVYFVHRSAIPQGKYLKEIDYNKVLEIIKTEDTIASHRYMIDLTTDPDGAKNKRQNTSVTSREDKLYSNNTQHLNAKKLKEKKRQSPLSSLSSRAATASGRSSKGQQGTFKVNNKAASLNESFLVKNQIEGIDNTEGRNGLLVDARGKEDGNSGGVSGTPRRSLRKNKTAINYDESDDFEDELGNYGVISESEEEEEEEEGEEEDDDIDLDDDLDDEDTRTNNTSNKRRRVITLADIIKKYTRRNVARTKGSYKSFSKRFKSVQDIPDLTDLADFNDKKIKAEVSMLEKKLVSPTKKPTHETIFFKVKSRLYSTDSANNIETQEAIKSAAASQIRTLLPARDNEFAQLYLSIYNAIETGVGSSVYISGTPGVGKTLTLREVVKDLLISSDQGEIPSFQYIEINGLKLVHPNNSYEVFWNKISGEKLTPSASLESLEYYFNKVPKNKKRTIVVLLDEMDTLVTKKDQDIMYNFFNWPTYPNSKLVVIAVGNTMDLPERLLSNKISSRLGLTRIPFPGYTHHELMAIIQSRLKGLNECFFFVNKKTGRATLATDENQSISPAADEYKKVKVVIEDDAIEIIARKIASVSGDARSALKICKRGIEIAEADYLEKHGYDIDTELNVTEGTKQVNDGHQTLANNVFADENDEIEIQKVDISHVMKAINETNSTPSSQFLSRLPFSAKLFLHAYLSLLKKNKKSDQSAGDIIDEVKLLIDVNGNNKYINDIKSFLYCYQADGTYEMRMIDWDYIINQLIDAGVISKQNIVNERSATIKLNISPEEISNVFKQDEVFKKL
ncbi:related to Origin recognition complex subunit 1 [Saccharomycodes ludwigii]|uniref:Origin recognition complex subunit 1 n=1 Tax=Saccharomycodes ludwigii TaxID=36035 RepID=A0A376B6H2_9ASCO|nr:hypothetical protein SCDLUD_004327 [Saccharomycodes ludwigii]KAH3900010.1 hypothetical protein SCDLUD_004327 [Saccharomycodes ludwigii]SSD59700.1 related to Origin recognition complex subunit 1 [Saccharomycodes ludwigii]